VVQRIKAFVKRSEPNPSWSDVSSMVANAVELADIELRRQQIRLTHYVAARLPQLMVDPILIEQVLVNLMKNGAESMLQAQRPPALRQLELKVIPRRIEEADVIQFSVRDCGKGVPPELLDRIYDAFYSTKSEGMGIGLKLCRSIIESHQGRIKVENLYNGQEVTGCVFSFWIPVLPPPKPGAASAPPSSESGASALT
jgi:signal transduction histidine kinase